MSSQKPEQQPAEQQQSSPKSRSKASKPRHCSLPGCDNPGILVCPICQEQRREKFWVCCQDHLVKCWAAHSPIHAEPLPVRQKKKSRSRHTSRDISTASPSPPKTEEVSEQQQQPAAAEQKQEDTSPPAQPEVSASPAAAETGAGPQPPAEQAEPGAAAGPVAPQPQQPQPQQPQPPASESAPSQPPAAEQAPVQPTAPVSASSPAPPAEQTDAPKVAPVVAIPVPMARRPEEVWNGREGNCRWRYMDQRWGGDRPTNRGYLCVTPSGQVTIYEKSDKKKVLYSQSITNSIVCVNQRLDPTEHMFRFQPDSYAASGKVTPVIFHPTHKDLRVEWCESFRRAGAAICRAVYEGNCEIPKRLTRKGNFKSYYCILYPGHLEFMKAKDDNNIRDDILIPLTDVRVEIDNDPKQAQKGRFGWTILHKDEPILHMQDVSEHGRNEWVKAFNNRLDRKYRFTSTPNEDIITAYEKWLDPLADAAFIAVRQQASAAASPGVGALDVGAANGARSALGSPAGPAAQTPVDSAASSAQPTPSQPRKRAPLVALDPVSVDGQCQRSECKEPRMLVCPTCQKKGLPKFWVCSQACLQLCWKAHKVVHKAPKQAAGPAAPAEEGKQEQPQQEQPQEEQQTQEPAASEQPGASASPAAEASPQEQTQSPQEAAPAPAAEGSPAPAAEQA